MVPKVWPAGQIRKKSCFNFKILWPTKNYISSEQCKLLRASSVRKSTKWPKTIIKNERRNFEVSTNGNYRTFNAYVSCAAEITSGRTRGACVIRHFSIPTIVISETSIVCIDYFSYTGSTANWRVEKKRNHKIGSYYLHSGLDYCFLLGLNDRNV